MCCVYHEEGPVASSLTLHIVDQQQDSDKIGSCHDEWPPGRGPYPRTLASTQEQDERKHRLQAYEEQRPERQGDQGEYLESTIGMCFLIG